MTDPQTSTPPLRVNDSLPSTSSASANGGFHYDVFISHRGPDVKNTFASYIYHRLLSHGMQPFLDREELQAGDYLTPQIEGAIRTASVHIVIFSPRFAESKWCLDELLLILETGATVFPVFYNVKPSELRWTGRYAEDLSIHEQTRRYDLQRIGNWRKALFDVSSIIGFELAAYNGDEGKLLEKLVHSVLKTRRKTSLNVARYPTGLQEKVEDFERKMFLQRRQQSGKAQVLGIVGLGGVGKTTLAKELFNRKSSDFGKSCFLFDVRESAGRRSLNLLQAKLIKDLVQRDVQIDNVHEGIEVLKTSLSSSDHALVVLDDVDEVDQLYAFLPIKDILRSDSLILVTSRYKDVLMSAGITVPSIYKLSGLSEEQSKQLFCSYAFCQPQPPLGFEYFVDEFCRACDGLPLSLKVVAGLLCQKSDKSYWEGQLDKLRQIELPSEIQNSLKISYEALGGEEKQIFLDVACYFIGEDRDIAIRIWDGSGWKGLVGFINLQEKCLVEVDTENRIKMHDHLRDLGRGIAEQQGSSGVMPRRPWRPIDDIDDLFQRSSDAKVISEVRGIKTVPRLISYYDIPKSETKKVSQFKIWLRHVFRNPVKQPIYTAPCLFTKLELIATEGGVLECIIKRVKSPNLVWLRWVNCPCSYLPSWLPMKKLRVLEVTGRNLETLWQEESQAPLELRELHIYSHLSNFPKSIGQLKHIEKIVVKHPLTFTGCPSVHMLPNSFGYLTNLQYLDLSYTKTLVELPNSFGYLTNLQYLDLSYTKALAELPNSFGNLTNLRHLNLSGCQSLALIPNSFGGLPNLEHLDLSDCESLQRLPDSFGCLTNLQHLNLSYCCSLQWVPGSFGCLMNLQHLDFSYCWALLLISSYFRNLLRLEHLNLRSFDLNTWPNLQDTFVNCRVRYFDLSWLKNISTLEYLDLSWCCNQRVSFDEGVYPNLTHLLLKNCYSLQEVGALPPTLVRLELSDCGKLRKIEDLCDLTKLQELDIRNCSELKKLPSMERLISLEKFWATGCVRLKRIRGLAALTKLRVLQVDNQFASNGKNLDVEGESSPESSPGKVVVEGNRFASKGKNLDVKSSPESSYSYSPESSYSNSQDLDLYWEESRRIGRSFEDWEESRRIGRSFEDFSVAQLKGRLKI